MNQKVYIVVLNWNGWRDTIECIESIQNLKYIDYTIVVIDNFSDNDSVKKIKSWASGNFVIESDFVKYKPDLKPLYVVEYDKYTAESGGNKEEELKIDAIPSCQKLVLIQTGANLGYAGGNNVGIRYALAKNDFDFLWILNNDTVVKPDSLNNMIEMLTQESSIGAVGSKILYYNRPDVLQTTAGGKFIEWLGYVKQIGWGEKDKGQWDRIFEVDFITGASILLCYNTIQFAGLMCEDYFMYAEDIDWCIRIKQTGLKLKYCPTSIIWHKEGGTVGYRSPLAEYYSSRNILIVENRFYKKFIFFMFLASLAIKIFNRLKRRQLKNLVYILHAYWDFLRGKSGKFEAEK